MASSTLIKIHHLVVSSGVNSMKKTKTTDHFSDTLIALVYLDMLIVAPFANFLHDRIL